MSRHLLESKLSTRNLIAAGLVALLLATCSKDDGGSAPGVGGSGGDMGAQGKAGAGGAGPSGGGGAMATAGAGGRASGGGGATGAAGAAGGQPGGGAGSSGTPDAGAAGRGGAGGSMGGSAGAASNTGGGAGIAATTIIDTHTHFWDLAKNPGFSDKMTRLPGDYDKIARPAGISGTVVVEAVWRNLQENMWGLEQAEANKIIVGVVGKLAIGSMTFKDDLDTLSKNKFFRGLRIGANELKLPNIKLLADKGLSVDVDLGGSAANLRSVAMDAKGLPDLKIVLDHAAGLGFGADPPADLAAAFEMAAQNPNVYCKVSRFQEQAGAKPAPTDAAAYKKGLDFLWKTFGEDHLFFGTNWPLAEAAGELGDAVKIMKSYFDAKGKDASEKFFWKNSMTAYKWIAR